MCVCVRVYVCVCVCVHACVNDVCVMCACMCVSAHIFSLKYMNKYEHNNFIYPLEYSYCYEIDS